MPMVSLRTALLSSVLSLALMSPALAQEAEVAPRSPDITPGVLLEPTAEEAAAVAANPPVTPIPEVWAPVPRDAEGRSAYGLYVAGRAAVSRGEGETGAAYLAAVERLTPEQPSVREQAFMTAMISGDLNDVARLLPEGPGVSPVLSEAGRLVAAIQTYAEGDARSALAMLTEQPIQPPHAIAAIFVTPWIAADAGNWERALDPQPSEAPERLGLFMRFTRAQLLEHRRRYDDAEVEFKLLTAAEPDEGLFRLAHGEFLERRGRRDEALALYDQGLASGTPQLSIAQAKARLTARGRPPQLVGLREGAAGALSVAAEAVAAQAGQGAAEFAAVYVRMALNVAPTDERRLALGRILFQARMEAGGRAALAEVGPEDGVVYAAAQSQIAASLLREEKPEAALAAYERATAEVPDNAGLLYLKAATLMQLERHEEALMLLTGSVLNTANQGAEVHFMRGAALESVGRIPEAEAELWAALQMRPNEPAFLNYLGYLWVDSGRRVEEGAQMIRRAHDANPTDGNIQDSLGWAQYRRGDYATAVVTLEEAVAKEPANAEINDHLGDAYWQVGRTREAGFQWNRVLTLEPDAERRAEVEQKLTDGLTPPVPVAESEAPGDAPGPVAVTVAGGSQP